MKHNLSLRQFIQTMPPEVLCGKTIAKIAAAPSAPGKDDASTQEYLNNIFEISIFEQAKY